MVVPLAINHSGGRPAERAELYAWRL